jgi:hypothetical protein
MDAQEERAGGLDSLGGILRETVRIFLRHPLSILALGSLPWIAIDAAAALLGVRAPDGVTLDQGLPASQMLSLSLWVLYLFVTPLVVFPLVEGALTQAMSEAHLRSSMPLGRAFRCAGHRWKALVGVHLRVLVRCAGIAIGTALGAFLLVPFVLPESWPVGRVVIPSVATVGVTYAYWLRWSLAIPVVVLEGEKPGVALARSRELTQGCRGWIFAVVVVGAVFSSLLNTGIRWVGASGGTGALLGTGLEYIALPLVYLGQRRRQEGYTATELAAALELEA